MTPVFDCEPVLRHVTSPVRVPAQPGGWRAQGAACTAFSRCESGGGAKRCPCTASPTCIGIGAWAVKQRCGGAPAASLFANSGVPDIFISPGPSVSGSVFLRCLARARRWAAAQLACCSPPTALGLLGLGPVCGAGHHPRSPVLLSWPPVAHVGWSTRGRCANNPAP
jgi:hypothetical protein